jgi:CubicO group peptidase (beta-lactamase class C family)
MLGIMNRRLLLLLMSLSLWGQAPPVVEQRVNEVQSAVFPGIVIQGDRIPTLEQRMAELHVPGVSIAVIHNGAIEWARGFGLATVGGGAVMQDTLFQAGSISKPVAAMAIHRLVQEGKLDLDTDVNQYLKRWKVPENKFTAKTKVTLRQLLSHTAGMTVHGFPGYAAGKKVPSIIEVLNGKGPANTSRIYVDLAPGTEWRYSGGGYTVAQLVVEDVTGVTFAKYLQDTVLGPIGMTHSTYQQPLPANRSVEAATPYRTDGSAVPGGAHTYPEMAAAGLWTTASDLARFAIEVQEALAGKSTRVISSATAQRMLTPGMNQWGLGPRTGGEDAAAYFGHGGSDEGFEANLVAFHRGDGVVVMTNGQNAGQLAQEITATVAEAYGWPNFRPQRLTPIQLDAAALAPFVGKYRFEQQTITVSINGDKLFAQVGGDKVELIPTSDKDFAVREAGDVLRFTIGPDGVASEFMMSGNTARRVDGSGAKKK